MAGLKKLVGVTLAAILIAAVVVYVLRPNATQSKGSVVVSEPGTTNGPLTPVPKPDTGDEWSHKRTPTGSGGTPSEQPPPDHENCTDQDHGQDRDGGDCMEHSDHDNHQSDWNSEENHDGHHDGSDEGSSHDGDD